ncbi:M15 family metallopeptidase [Streptomyces sp. NPDC001668]|uniref:M15 family metallopeptidase n=1 Tax=unclassified Streptomyces TaxID=2593676 RepID=UPI0036C87BB0
MGRGNPPSTRPRAAHAVRGRVRGRVLVDDRKHGRRGYLRQGVLDRLLRAQDLLPDGLRLLFVEAYRPPALQRHCSVKYADELRALHPDWSPNGSAPVPDATSPRGAAVDLTLADADGRELDLGTAMNANPEESDGACYTGAADITEEAKANRAVLGDALSTAGLVNYPTEWWHWSYGDRYWALQTGAPAALYGSKELQGRWSRRLTRTRSRPSAPPTASTAAPPAPGRSPRP